MFTIELEPLVLLRCSFANNQALAIVEGGTPSARGGFGGGWACYCPSASCTPTLQHCSFTGNVAHSGEE